MKFDFIKVTRWLEWRPFTGGQTTILIVDFGLSLVDGLAPLYTWVRIEGQPEL
jgi:hypothetical protein